MTPASSSPRSSGDRRRRTSSATDCTAWTPLQEADDDILALVAELHTLPFEPGVPRVYTVLKLDDPGERTQSLDEKVRSVEAQL